MKRLKCVSITKILRPLSLMLFYYGICLSAYPQNSIYSDPLLISKDTNMVATMAASVLDKHGDIHIAYVGWYYEPGAPDDVASEIFYTTNQSGDFAEPFKLPSAAENSLYYSKEPSIAVDSGGTIHIAYYRVASQLAGAGSIFYTNNSNGDFSEPKRLNNSSDPYSGYFSYGNHVMLAADPDNDSIHIVFDGNSGTGHGGARYSIGYNGEFLKPITITQRSESPTIRFDNSGTPNLVYWINTDTTDVFSNVNLVKSTIVNNQFTSPEILYIGESSFSQESAFAFDQNDTIHVVFRNLDLGIFHKQMQYVKGKDGYYSSPEELPTPIYDVSLMYSIEIGKNQTKYIAYKQAADRQSLGFMYNDGNGFKDISPTEYDKYGFMSAGPQHFILNHTNNKSYFIYTTGQIYIVTIDLNSPEIPTLINPSNNSSNQPLTLTLAWNTSERADYYALQVSTYSDFSSNVVDDNELVSTSKEITGLSNNTTYFWRVNAANAGGPSDWSETWNFTTINPVSINLNNPNEHYRLFPNPVNDVLYFEGIENKNTKVLILSIDGIVLKEIHTKGNNQIDLSDLPNGTYILKILDSKNIYTSKINKQ